METREQLLRRLVQFERPLEPILARLKGFGWDSELELVELSAADARQAILAYVRQDASRQEIEEWAIAVEGRDDLAVAGAVWEIIHELANPLLTEPTSSAKASALITRLHDPNDAGS